MEQKMYQDENGKVFYKEYNLDDLIEGIEAEGMSKERIKEICKEFFSMMTKDLILDNNYFVFPERNFGYITIGDISNTRSSSYNTEFKYNFNTNGAVYQPIISDNDFRRGKNMLARFIGETERMFQDEISNNHHY